MYVMTAVNLVLTGLTVWMWFDTRKRNEEMKWVIGNALTVIRKVLKKMRGKR